jgi:hypothetical protein
MSPSAECGHRHVGPRGRKGGHVLAAAGEQGRVRIVSDFPSRALGSDEWLGRSSDD